MDYKEIIKERIKILPEQLRAFVVDENWRREAEKIGKQFNLSEEKYTPFENEVFLVLSCFEPRADFAENIKRELEIDSNMAGWVDEEVNKSIFIRVSDEINAMRQSEEVNETPPQNNIGNSFEQIILNQAKAMRPAMPAGEVPHNLPRAEQSEQEKPSDFAQASPDKKVIHNYIGESDPYREPIQ